jgi:RpiB/LacA/LacB family sugar-phosphate isomerase
MRIALGCDHAGFPYKLPLRRALEADGHDIIDLGTSSPEPVDYPDYAYAVGTAVRTGEAATGILICGSGAGVAVAANKIRGIRAALCHDLFTARQAREDDDANVLCLGARVIAIEMAITLAREFLGASFSGAPRHVRRLAKVARLEETSGLSGSPELPHEAAPAVTTTTVTAWPAASAALDQLTRTNAAARIWDEDATLWSTEDRVRASIRHRLGWLTTARTMKSHVDELVAFADDVRRDGITSVLLLGMGGSSLVAETLARSLGTGPGFPALSVLDTTDAGTVCRAAARLEPSRTLFLVSSKSGTTAEMRALYRFFRARLEGHVNAPGRHFVAITDPGTPLERLAADAGFRRTFLNDPRIGGRYSALSYFGLVPAALLGIDVRAMLERAEAMATRCGPSIAAAENPGLLLGAILGGLAGLGRDKVTLVLSEPVASLGPWIEQLVTESTGKGGMGIVVVHDEPRLAVTAYGADRVFVSTALPADVSNEPWLRGLEAAGHPVVRLTLADPLDVAGEFFRWEFATATAGAVLRINPFDEPDVAQAKDATQAALATFKDQGALPEWPVDGVEAVARVLAQARAGDYVALLVYLTPTAETVSALQALRALVLQRTRLATTLGFGPRYLHSTGQLHKGGPPTAIALLFTAPDAEDAPIPGESYGFSILKAAQALGDLATLRAAHRRALLLRVDGRPAETIGRLTAALAKLLTTG